VSDLVLELWIRGFWAPVMGRHRPWPVGAAVGVVVLGGILGGLTSWMWPAMLMASRPLPGASLFLVPVVNGALMYGYGLWQERRGRRFTFVATFWGGALFGFGFAVVRFLMVA